MSKILYKSRWTLRKANGAFPGDFIVTSRHKVVMADGEIDAVRVRYGATGPCLRYEEKHFLKVFKQINGTTVPFEK